MEIVILLAVVGIAIFLVSQRGNVAIVPTTAVQKIAKAIAKAEGFYVQGSIPQRANNPGDLERGDIGFGVIALKTIYPSAGQGWEAIYHQIGIMLDNSSAVYGPTWTIQDVADEYVSGMQSDTKDSVAWAQNVADSLGVSVDTQIGTIA